MKCLNCNNNAKGKSKYCSDRRKVTYNRNKKRNTGAVTPESVTTVTQFVGRLEPISKPFNPECLPANFGLPDCQCMMCQTNRINNNKSTINHGPAKTADQLALNEFNRQTLPGDVDYKP